MAPAAYKTCIQLIGRTARTVSVAGRISSPIPGSVIMSAILFAGLALAAPGHAPATSFDEKTVDELVADALRAWEVPGTIVVVVRRDRVMYIKGTGVREAGRSTPMTPDTVFPLASCSKGFTTTLVAMLASDGKLSWDDPVRKHLPDFLLTDPHSDALVTLRDLACHRTGLASHDLLWYRAAWGPEEMVRRAGRLPADYPFRSGFQYQSLMFTATGLAAGRAGGEPWDVLLRKRIFEPLGMKSAGCTSAEAMKLADRATGHRPDRDGKIRPVEWYPQPEPNPAGSVHASGRDLAAWLRFQLGDGTFEGTRLVKAADLSETHTPQVVLPMDADAKALHPDTVQMSYTLGWVVQDYRGHLEVSHAGLIDGFRVHLTLLPDDGWGIAVLCNRHATRMNLALNNRLVDEVLGLPPRDWNKNHLAVVRKSEEEAKRRAEERARHRNPGVLPSLPLVAYTGAYEHPAYGTAHVVRDGASLRFEWSTFKAPLEHYRGDEFTLKEQLLDDPPLEFAAAPDGSARRLRVFGVVFERARGQ
jgi:CubicO group peptidase (beta-lactamase class C family)